MAAEIRFVVNGKPATVQADASMPLLTALREDLGLKATRFGCGAETCGTCTVIVDGAARYSCTLPIGEVAGCHVRTAEGLEGNGSPHPLLVAFLDHQAGQCGYCLPGILMRAQALLDAGNPVNREQIAQALDANLCRCGAHGRILDAIVEAAERMGPAA